MSSLSEHEICGLAAVTSLHQSSADGTGVAGSGGVPRLFTFAGTSQVVLD